MPTPQSVKRRNSFRKALIDEGILLKEFCARLGVSRQHVALAFTRPKLVRRWVHDAIDQLIEKHTRNGRAA